MNLLKKLLVLLSVLFCLQTFAIELSVDLQKACAKEQHRAHKGIKGHSLESSDFKDYCSCETDFVVGKATQDQLSQFSKNQNANPTWLKQLKSKAQSSCLELKNKATT